MLVIVFIFFSLFYINAFLYILVSNLNKKRTNKQNKDKKYLKK